MANSSCSSETTSSRCVTGSATAAHDFEVASFSLLDGMGNGRSVSSGGFTVGGCDWAITLFPDGSQTEGRGSHVSVYLYLCGGATRTGGVRVSFSLSLLDKDGGVSHLRGVPAKTFTAAGQDWGFSHFIEKSKLQRMIRLNGDDCFTIRCVVTVIMEPRSESVDKAAIAPPSSLHQDLADMMKNGEGADVTLSVGGRVFHAHRCMLAARSKVFMAELFGAMKEKGTGCIEIDDMEPAIFEALLHFIYTDSILVDDDCKEDENAAMQHLLVAADRYALDRLKVMCESKLCQGIDVQTVATTLVLAEQHRCTQLKDACLGFIASKNVLDAIVQTDGFKHLVASCPMIMKEILDKAAAIRRQ